MSIQALADSLGISISTVSRALNGYSDVSAATRQRVFDAAKAMSYMPHPVAHRLATGKTGAVAIVNSARAGNAADGNSAPLHAGVDEALRSQNYFALTLTLPLGEQEMPELVRLLDGRLVDGIVLTRTRSLDPCVQLLQERRIPFVTYGRTMDNAPHAWVDIDNEAVYEQATRALMALGHQRIALLNGMAHMTFAHLRERGFRTALQEAGISQDACPVHHTDLSSSVGKQLAAQMLASPQRPSAFLCATDALALGVMAAVREAGLEVGREVSVMGYGNSEAGQFVQPRLATIDHGMLSSSRHIAQLLLRAMAGENAAQLQVLESPSLIMRESVGRFLP